MGKTLVTRPDFDPYSGFHPDTDLDEIVFGKEICGSPKNAGRVSKWVKALFDPARPVHKQDEPPPRPKLPDPKVTISVAGRWRYKIVLQTSWFSEATWYRYGLERAKRKASYELYKHCKEQDMLDLPPVVTYQPNI